MGAREEQRRRRVDVLEEAGRRRRGPPVPRGGRGHSWTGAGRSDDDNISLFLVVGFGWHCANFVYQFSLHVGQQSRCILHRLLNIGKCCLIFRQQLSSPM
jgi:hypothetical protein